MLSSEDAACMVGAVVIGRNEGERLRICLQSLVHKVAGLVYVDSGSTDHSLQIAESLGVSVVNLDMSVPFTAARARNEGFAELKRLSARVRYVQFVDGDCEVVAVWLEAGCGVLEGNEDIGVVCGRRRERFPEKSMYNRLCDIEWDTPVGEADACGGDALIRVAAFEQVGGYNSGLIAGEEPEMCVRLRRRGWKILRVDVEMTRHDANMIHFSQWWKRMLRSGYAYAEGAWLHGDSPERHWVREVRRNWIWGLSFPLLILMAAVWPDMALLLLVYPVQAWRIYNDSCLQRSSRDRRLFAFFCVLAKLPLVLGQLRFHVNRMTGSKSRIIEYK